MNAMNNRPNPNGQAGNMGSYRGNMGSRGCRNRQPNGVMGDADMARMMYNCQNDPSNDDDPLYGMPVGMGYVPWQHWGKIYDPPEGLANATIFPELNLQFCGCVPKGAAYGKGGRS